MTSSSDGLATAASASSGAPWLPRSRRMRPHARAGVRRRRRRRSRGRRQLRRRQRLVGGLLRGRSPPPCGRACARRRGRRRRARHRAPQPAVLERERGVARRKRPNELRRLRRRQRTARRRQRTAPGWSIGRVSARQRRWRRRRQRRWRRGGRRILDGERGVCVFHCLAQRRRKQPNPVGTAAIAARDRETRVAVHRASTTATHHIHTLPRSPPMAVRHRCGCCGTPLFSPAPL